MSGVEYDPAKNAANRKKHGIDFDRALRIWEGPVFEFEDARFDYGEKRFIALGSIEGRVIVAVFTWRGPSRRLISARKANAKERRIFEAAVARIAGQG